MKMSLVEKSECFRSFLILIGIDGKISAEERRLLLMIGKKLDFERSFCETAINDLLENNYINREPPQFSRKEIAEEFIRDSISIACSDDELHPHEKEWLARVAEKNSLSTGVVKRLCDEHGHISRSRKTLHRLSIERFL
jgi:uncharacterized tellurite resistance protein B-like protein